MTHLNFYAIDYQCPNCNQKGLTEISTIEPIIWKCEGCGSSFAKAFVRGYWFNRPDLNSSEVGLLVKAADFCAATTAFSDLDKAALKGVANKLFNSLSVDVLQDVFRE